VSPAPCVPTQAHRRSGGTVGRPPPHAGAADQLFTSAPCAAHAAATSTCVPRLYPLCSYHTRRSSFLFPLDSPLLFCCRASSPSPPFPEHPVIVRTGEPEPPPSPPRVALRSSSRRRSPVLELAHHRLRFLRFTGHH
jgi:hypothetical protein